MGNRSCQSVTRRLCDFLMWAFVAIGVLLGAVLLFQGRSVRYTANMFFTERYTRAETVPAWVAKLGLAEMPAHTPYCDWGHLDPAEFAALFSFLKQYTELFKSVAERWQPSSDPDASGSAQQFAAACCVVATQRRDNVSLFAVATAAYLVYFDAELGAHGTDQSISARAQRAIYSAAYSPPAAVCHLTFTPEN